MSNSQTSYSAAGIEFTVYAMRLDDKPKRAIKFVFRNHHVSYVDTNGRMFSTRLSRGAWYVGKNWTHGRHLEIIRDAVALGIVSKKAAVERLAKMEAERSRKEQQAIAANDALAAMKLAGVEITPSQMRALKRMCGYS